ncbi:MAG TPA: HNH endonuclease [Thermomonas sp.]|nr:HNH endonuclease [Thermomonas sp.]
MLIRDAYTCRHCKRIAAGKGQAHVDHVDGNASNNDLSNLQVLCWQCHSVKTAKEDRGFGNPRA